MATQEITDSLANASLQEPSAIQDGQQNDESNHLNLRSLVSTREAGIIIGKGGANVAAIREKTGVKAGVSKAIPGVQDRVLSVGGSAEEISKAYCMIAQNLVDNSTTDHAAPATNSNNPAPTTVRLLVAHGVMGSIIGKQGAKIKQIQDSTSVRMVASKDLLPQSTERVVEITGAPSNIGEAVSQISDCLVEESERSAGSILFHPASVTAPSNVGIAIAANGGQGAGYNPSHPGGYGGLSALPSVNASGYSRGRGSRGGFRYPSGGGRGASNQSYQNRRVSERLFSIIGTHESNEKALYLLYSSLEKEKERRDKEQQEHADA